MHPYSRSSGPHNRQSRMRSIGEKNLPKMDSLLKEINKRFKHNLFEDANDRELWEKRRAECQVAKQLLTVMVTQSKVPMCYRQQVLQAAEGEEISTTSFEPVTAIYKSVGLELKASSPPNSLNAFAEVKCTNS